jgi:2-methylisocitrate lyase-like PEP mutase family enzyme
MIDRAEKVRTFRTLHAGGCFVIANPWDVGSAGILARSGFKALATTSSGYAFSKGRSDGIGDVGRDESLAYAAAIAAATDLPVSADLEDGYAQTPEGVAETVGLAAEAGLAGLSIEDSDPSGTLRIRDFESAVARVAAAVAAARRHDIVLTARADGLITGAYDLEEAVRRLQAFEKVGAEVLYAPAIPDLAALRAVCLSVKRPVNHLVGLGVAGLSLAEIAGAGVRRISLGGSLARAVGGALVAFAGELAAGRFSAVETAPSWDSLRPKRVGTL